MIAGLALGSGASALADVTGTVYRDYDGDGVRAAAEPGVEGIAVSAYGPDGGLDATTLTAADGSYSLAGTSGQVRVEFTNLPSYLLPGVVGGESATTVRFVDGSDSGVDLALGNPAEFNRGTPTGLTSVHIAGDVLAEGSAGEQDAIISYPYDGSGTDRSRVVALAKQKQVGALHGMAVQRSSGKVFAAALAKRHAGLGPYGTGAIYWTDIDIPPGPNDDLLFFDLNAVLGSTVTGSIGNRDLAGTAGAPSHDPNAWDAVGKVAFGDLDISEDETTLWTVSLANRVLYEVFIGKPAAAPGAGDITPHQIPDPGCSNGEYRPFATKVHDGLVYVGVTCSAETSQDVADLEAYVLSYDPASDAWATEFNVPLDYPRGVVSTSNTMDAEWRPWVSTMHALARNGKLAWNKQAIYPQPILADIEFDETGAMILGLMDRNGHQTGNLNYNTTPGTPTFYDLATGTYKSATQLGFSDTKTYEGAAAGDMLRACDNGSGWDLEQNGICGGVQTKGSGTNQGPGNGEFYWQDMYSKSTNPQSGTHTEIGLGGLAAIPGAGEVMTTVYDPYSDYRAAGVSTFYNDGPNVGSRYNNFELFRKDALGTFGKASGLSDVELLLDEAPVEIGNRVWNDANGNGVQDADEVGIGGVAVEFYDDQGGFVASAQTDPSGNYLFSSDAEGSTTASAIYDLALVFGATYQLRIDLLDVGNQNALGAKEPTVQDASSLGQDDDIRDSDGDNGGLNANHSTIELVLGDAGENDHTYDYGFTESQTLSLGDTLWFDWNNDGLYDSATESSFPGVTVELYKTGENPATTSPTQTVQTDANGNYLFTGLEPGTYFVHIPSSEFGTGGPLEDYAKSTGAGTSTTPNDDIDDDNNATIDQAGGVSTNGITLSLGGEPDGGNRNLSLDLGFIAGTPLQLGDIVWLDDNDTGVNDGEAGISGITVELFRAGDDPATATPIATTTTDGSGNYLFQNLPAGDYFVYLPSDNFASGAAGDGLASSSATGEDPNPGTNNVDKGDPDANGGITSQTINLTADNLNIDFGLIQTLSLGDTVWFDLNKDGDFDAGTESGIPGVLLELYQAGDDPATVGPVATTNSDAGGSYLFSGLLPGDYFVYVPASNFASGGPLFELDRTTLTADSNNPNTNTDDDSNVTSDLFGGMTTPSIELSSGVEPAGGGNYNPTLDLGFESDVAVGLDKTVTPTTQAVGSDVNYTYTIANTGSATLDDFELCDDPHALAPNCIDLTGTAAFEQDGGAQGVVSLEAETNTGEEAVKVQVAGKGSGSTHTWGDTSTIAGSSGGEYVLSSPNSGANWLNDADNGTNAHARIDYTVDFTKTGTHYVWMRVYSNDDQDNSYWLGIDGDSASAQKMEAAPLDNGQWVWIETLRRESTRAVINVANAGVHTISLWGREDGAIVDKIVLTTDINYDPSTVGSGLGPDQSTLSPDGLTSLAPGETYEATLTYTIQAGDAPGPLVNVATVTASNESDTESVSDSDDAQVTILGQTAYDLGDLPDGIGGSPDYETLLASGGPRHQIVDGLYLGGLVDSESDGQPTAAADGDDSTGTSDDEDGVTLPGTITAGSTIRVPITGLNNSGSSANIQGYIDWNGDGDFNDTGETLSGFSKPDSATPFTENLTVVVPANAATGTDLGVRFRISNAAIASPNGDLASGEVEDYLIQVAGQSQAATDWGDLPSAYPVTDAESGPSHTIVDGLLIGTAIDGDDDGQESNSADGDDTDAQGNDEDGVTLPLSSNMVAGTTSSIGILVTNTTGSTAYLKAWIDFDGSGTFEADELVVDANDAGGSLPTTFPVDVPSDAVAGTGRGVRVRLSNDADMNATGTGAAASGEVEDYLIELLDLGTVFDWGDLPDGQGRNYDTQIASGGPSHQIVSGLYLGNAVDNETDGQQNATATGDDSAGIDDEDGIVLPTQIVEGTVISIPLDVTNNTGSTAYLKGWVDWDGDGNITASELIIDTDDGTNAFPTSISVTVPGSTANTDIGVRLRLSNASDMNDTGTGAATSGEVEDYLIDITTASTSTDRGDLPETFGTSLASHPIDPNIYFGAAVDEDPVAGQPTPDATGDDADGMDDEDGIYLPATLQADTTVSIPFDAVNNTGNDAFIKGWIDFDNDGIFQADELVVDITVAAGEAFPDNLSVTVPDDATTGADLGARFRISTDGSMNDTGNDAATDGEVEDYRVQVTAPAVTYDWGDLPDDNAFGSYPTDSIDGNGEGVGPSHQLIAGLYMGAGVDAEVDGQPTAAADGDDQITADDVDDEDGATIPAIVTAGTTFALPLAVTNATGDTAYLKGWIDWNGDGVLADSEVVIDTSSAADDLSQTLSVEVPRGATTGKDLGVRLRLTTDADAGSAFPPTGEMDSGEVEDYLIQVESTTSLTDWGDLPDGSYATTDAQDGPSHGIVSGLRLGAAIDAESDGQPNADATGDDLSDQDDEDGVTLPAVDPAPGDTFQLDVMATNDTGSDANVKAWIDWNGDGTFTDDEIVIDQAAAAGTNTISEQVLVPGGAATTDVGVRVRISNQEIVEATGALASGEVEDYLLTISDTPVIYDLGDLPDDGDGSTGAGEYYTLLVNGGPRHQIVEDLYLGNRVDNETDGQPNTTADGDDTAPAGQPDDEDGVTLPAQMTAGTVVPVDISVYAENGSTAHLEAWIDWNGNGVLDDAGEQIADLSGANSSQFPSTISVVVPADAVTGQQLGVRFRLSNTNGMTPLGDATAGEVEDYVVEVVAPANGSPFDLGDLPDAPYDTVGASNGAKHLIDQQIFMGVGVDDDADGQPTSAADGDDSDGTDDEDGVTLPATAERGATIDIDVSAVNQTGQPGQLEIWIDFNGDGFLDDATEKLVDATEAAGDFSNTYPVNVPIDAATGDLGVRVRFSTTNDMTPTGTVDDGEVEDYLLSVIAADTYDWGDLPEADDAIGVNYPTSDANGGPSHLIVDGLYLGALVDSETDGQSTAGADGDDLTGTQDDEDGVVFNSALIAGQSGAVTVTASAVGTLSAWIDFNRDGDFADAGETIITGQPTASGKNGFQFSVPSGASTAGVLGARFRFTEGYDEGGDAPTGPAINGEVEDYLVSILPASTEVDYGDLPDSLGYPTTAIDNGASHVIVLDVYLGNQVDADSDGQPSAAADGDDVYDGNDDEDGVTFNGTLQPGQDASIDVVAGGDGYLNAWADFNGNGTLEENSERIFSDQFLSKGNNAGLTFQVPATVTEGDDIYLRFRFTSGSGEATAPTGQATNGEVEDYVQTAAAPPVALVYDWGDLPDFNTNPGANTYPTKQAQNGPRHVLDGVTWLGDTVDSEGDGQPTGVANGDDLNGADEDGVTFDTLLIPGAPAQITVNASAANSVLNAWIDFDGNGTLEADERIASDRVLAAGDNVLNITVPLDATSGTTNTRFRVTAEAGQGGDSVIGAASTGEVEDHQVTIQPANGTSYDFGDLPESGTSYPTIEANDGARHVIDGTTYLGAGVDEDSDGQPNSSATGDDTDGNDDEDGVTFVGQLIPGSDSDIIVVARVAGHLNAWIDFNGNGILDGGEQVFDDQLLTGGSNDLTITVPGDAVVGTTYARFRFNTTDALGGDEATGAASNGEVEDYQVSIDGTLNKDWGDLPEPKYPTTNANSGPNHSILPSQNPVLGSIVDAETNGQPTAAANGDDVTGSDDEDGVTLPAMSQGENVSITYVVNDSGASSVLNAWIDWDNSGTFDSGEQVATDVVPDHYDGTDNTLNLTVPLTAVVGADLGVRFRLSNQSGLGATGPASDGEVEDYLVSVTAGAQDKVAIGNLVWLDNGAGGGIANNGVLDGTEAGIDGVTVDLRDGSGALIDSTETAGGGWYFFDQQLPGTYYVEVPSTEFASGQELFELLSSSGAGTSRSDDHTLDENGIDDADPATNGIRSMDYTLSVGGEPQGENQTGYSGIQPDNNVNGTLDFGFVEPSSAMVAIGNRVWLDDGQGGGIADNGLIDGTEAGIPNVEVELYTAGDVYVGRTTTDGNGRYWFDNLAEGSYYVLIPDTEFGTGEPLVGLLSSTDVAAKDETTDDNLDENGIDDADPASNGIRSNNFTLGVGNEPDDDDETDYPGVLPDVSVNATDDFGFYNPVGTKVAIGNRVWLDNGAGTANDGVLNGGEAGIDDVTVELCDSSDALVESTTTANGGYYYFDGLGAGQYYVKLPASEFQTGGELIGMLSSTGAGGNETEDHDIDENGIDDADPANNGIRSNTFNLQPGTEREGEDETGYPGILLDDSVNGTADFGLIEPTTTLVAIGNRVWLDDGSGTGGIANDGAINGDEAGISGVEVELYDAGDNLVRSTTTDAGGRYWFDNLAEGSYYVLIPSREFATGSLVGLLSSTGDGNDEVTDETDDENGIDDPAAASNGIRSNTFTLSVGGEPDTDDQTGYLGLLPNDSVNGTDDFGFYNPLTTNVAIGNRVWLDDGTGGGIVNNGVLDGGETGVDGVRVELYDSADQFVGFTTTSGGGYYWFDDLSAGQYYVVLPATQFQATGPLQGLVSSTGAGGNETDDETIDENGIDDADPSANGLRSNTFNLQPGSEPENDDETTYPGGLPDDSVNATNDFGLIDPQTSLVAIGNRVWLDDGAGGGIANDGVINGDEAGIPNVVVELYDSGDNRIGDTVTDANGRYWFDNLAEGSYYVVIPGSEFGVNEPLDGLLSTIDAGNDAVSDEDIDENGIDSAAPASSGIRSNTFTLGVGGEPQGDDETDYPGVLPNASVNATDDFGFISPAATLVGIGNVVFYDDDDNGIFEPTGSDIGVDSVTVELYFEGEDPASVTAYRTTTTGGGGFYAFDNLPEGRYFVHIPPDQFGTGAPLDGLASSTGAGADDGNDDDEDENGQDGGDPTTSGVSSIVFDLGVGQEPEQEPGAGGYTGDLPDNNVDFTADLGFAPPPLTCYEICDVNTDSVVNRTDLILIGRSRGVIVNPPGSAHSGDCNLDGIISVNDVRACVYYQ